MATLLTNPNNHDFLALGTAFEGSVHVNGSYAVIGHYTATDPNGPTSKAGRIEIYYTALGDWSDTVKLHTIFNPNLRNVRTDYFGYKVAINNTYTVAVAYAEQNETAELMGAVHVFDTATGNLLHSFDNPDTIDSTKDRFGASIALEGSTLIVGSPYEDTPVTTDAGCAYVYDLSAGTLTRTIIAGGSYDYFGYSVAIQGDSAIIGNPREGIAEGTVRIYSIATGLLSREITNPNSYSTATSDEFGKYLSVSGNYVAVAAPGEDSATKTDGGVVYIFDHTTGTLKGTITTPGTMPTDHEDWFGYSISLEGSKLLVASRNVNINIRESYVYSYESTLGDWTDPTLVATKGPINYAPKDLNDLSSGIETYYNPSQLTSLGNGYYFIIESGATSQNGTVKVYSDSALSTVVETIDVGPLVDPNIQETELFGNAIDTDGSYIIIGAPRTHTAAFSGSVGTAYIYDTAGNLVASLDNPVNNVTDYFGHSVAISGNYAAVSAYETSRKVYVYETVIGDWSDISLLYTINDPSATSTNFGYAIEIAGNELFVSSPTWDQPVRSYVLSTGALVNTFTPPGGLNDPNHFYGWDISVDNGKLAVYYRAVSTIEQAVIFNTTTAAYIGTVELETEDAVSEIHLSGNYLVSSTPTTAGDVDPLNDRSITTYYTELGDWSDTTTLYRLSGFRYESEGTAGGWLSELGRGISVSNGKILAGGMAYNNIDYMSYGRAWIYDLATGAMLYEFKNPDTIDYTDFSGYAGGINLDDFGNTVKLHGNNIIVAGNFGFANVEGTNYARYDAGRVYIEDMTTLPLIVPVANADEYTSVFSDTVVGDLSLNDEKITYNDTYVMVSDPQGYVSLNPDGTFTYTPPFCKYDDYVWTYKIVKLNGTESNIGTVTVHNVEPKPSLFPDNYTNINSETTVADLSVNDLCIRPGYTYHLVSDVTGGGTVDIATDGTLTFTPPTCFTGDYVITYKVRTPIYLRETEPATITISCSEPAVIAVDDNYTNHNWVTTVGDVSTNDICNQPTYTYSLVGGPYDKLDYFNADGTFSFTNTYPFLGNYTFQYKVTKPNGYVSNTATVTVNCTRTAPNAVNDTFTSTNWETIVEDVSLNDTFFAAYDVFQIEGTPPVELDYFNSDGTFGFTPTYPFQGDYTFQYRVFDPQNPTYFDIGTVTVTSVFDYNYDEYPRLLAQAGGDQLALNTRFPFLRDLATTEAALIARTDMDYHNPISGAVFGNRLGPDTGGSTLLAALKIIQWVDKYLDYTNNYIPRSFKEIVDLTFWDSNPSAKPAEVPTTAYSMGDPEFWSMGISEIVNNEVKIYLEPAYTNGSDVAWFGQDPTYSARDAWFSTGEVEWAGTNTTTDYPVTGGVYSHEFPIFQTCRNSSVYMDVCASESTYDGSTPHEGCFYNYYKFGFSPSVPAYLFNGKFYYHTELSPTGTFHDYEEPRTGSSTYLNSTDIKSFTHFLTEPPTATYASTIGSINIPLDTNGNLIEPASVVVKSQMPSMRHTTRSMKVNVVNNSTQRYEFTFEYAPMSLENASSLINMIDRYKGRANYFYMPVPFVAALGVNTIYNEAGNTDNTVAVVESVHPTSGETSGAKGDDTVWIQNCPVDYFPAGLLLRFDNHDKLYKTVEESTRAADNSVKLKFEPPLRQSIEGANIVLRESYDNFAGTHNLVRVRLADDYLDYNTDATGLTVIKIKFVEDI